MIDLSEEPRARGFRFDGGRRGCLLLHGFTGTPAEVRPIGEALAARGCAVVAPLLPGHGTRVEDLAGTRWQDWFGCALEAWDALGRSTESRGIAGLSMGALLALHLAHDRADKVRAVAALAPALRLRNQRAAEHSVWLSRVPFLPRRMIFLRKTSSERRTPHYDEIPVAALASMIHLQRVVRAELPTVHAPALVIEGGRDLTIAPEAGRTVESALGSVHKRRLVFPESGHILPEEVDADAVCAAVVSFFAEWLPRN